ncbi:MAG: hypothetical protein JWP29_5564 [Rhodoferax sp.]|nr:hypothetical protein [Rhodoferax sp.]
MARVQWRDQHGLQLACPFLLALELPQVNVTSTAAMLTDIATAWTRAFSAGDFFGGKTECGDSLGKIVTEQFHASQVLRRSAIHVALLGQPEHFLPF